MLTKDSCTWQEVRAQNSYPENSIWNAPRNANSEEDLKWAFLAFAKKSIFCSELQLEFSFYYLKVSHHAFFQWHPNTHHQPQLLSHCMSCSIPSRLPISKLEKAEPPTLTPSTKMTISWKVKQEARISYLVNKNQIFLLPVVTIKVFSMKLQILSLSCNYRKAALKDEWS